MIQAQALVTRFQSVNWQKHRARATTLIQEKPMVIGLVLLFLVMSLNWFAVIFGKPHGKIVETVRDSSFQGGRVLSDSGTTYYRGREKQLAKMTADLLDRQNAVDAKLKELDQKLAGQATPLTATDAGKTPTQTPEVPVKGGVTEVRLHDSPLSYEPSQGPPGVLGFNGTGSIQVRRSGRGSNLIAFPVKDEAPSDGVVLPAGSYVKAKMLTGVDAPEGKPYPVLLVLDYSYISPNDSRVDLSGCFMIAKAEGNLSTERIEGQATKLSCVSKNKKMFERDVNGFIADHSDGSFGIKGKVNTKQGRVAAMAFMSSVVEGVGRAVQQSQTTNTVNPLGGSSSVMTGDAEKYAVAGGAANAGSMVAQWYLKQAQNLSPTVSAESAREVWIIMKDKVDLPKEFFRKERSSSAETNVYSYLSRVAD